MVGVVGCFGWSGVSSNKSGLCWPDQEARPSGADAIGRVLHGCSAKHTDERRWRETTRRFWTTRFASDRRKALLTRLEWLGEKRKSRSLGPSRRVKVYYECGKWVHIRTRCPDLNEYCGKDAANLDGVVPVGAGIHSHLWREWVNVLCVRSKEIHGKGLLD